MTLADTHVLARLADGILIVVRAGVTSRPALEHALEGVERERIAGLVLNDVDLVRGEPTRARTPGPPERNGWARFVSSTGTCRSVT